MNCESFHSFGMYINNNELNYCIKVGVTSCTTNWIKKLRMFQSYINQLIMQIQYEAIIKPHSPKPWVKEMSTPKSIYEGIKETCRHIIT